MFIYTGKSLFGNVGLIISLIILIILLYFSYNKCYMNNEYNIDTFYNPPTSTDMQLNLIAPSDVRININGSSIIVKFTIDNSLTNIRPNNFIIILAQYNTDKINTGNNKFYLSNETIFNPNLQKKSQPLQNSSISNVSNNKESHVCDIIEGVPVCQYVFNNIDIKDDSGNLYYYKLGISAIYSDGNSKYITPYNINSADSMFTINNTVDNQNIENANLQECKKTIADKKIISSTYNDMISTPDGQYELIKSQLGNYPDNLFLDDQTINSGTLSDIVDKSMAQALLNINVSVQ